MRKKEKKKINTVRGIISINSRGVGYIESIKFPEKVIEIENNLLKTALNKDEVEIAIGPKKGGKNLSGEVIKIINRNREEFVCVIEKNKQIIFAIPDDKRMYRDIFIPSGKSKNAKSGEKVLVRMEGWPDQNKNPIGKVLEIIGKKGDHDTEMKSIVLDKGLDINFPKEVSKEAINLAQKFKEIPKKEIETRKDIRNIPTFTIDPDDAKDFDDAISVKKVGDDWQIGIHIADVSYFVKEGSVLDKEARKRSFSIYLVDRTIPMLPEELSNDLCSLNPNEDKLAFSSIFTINQNGEVKDEWFGKTIINSDKRFSYEDAQDILNKKSGQLYNELSILDKIAKKLKEEKIKKGAIEFESDEVKFTLDKNGAPVKISKKERLDTHKLIEEFMLLSNKRVAEFMYKYIKKNDKGFFIYRIHDLPDREKILELAIFLRALGYEMKNNDGEIEPGEINKILKQSSGKEEESLIRAATIRSMSKAIYSTKNKGHFGLAFEFYTHFTSPIRRYTDLIVHRTLEKTLNKNKLNPNDLHKYERISVEASEKEIEINEAERASIKYKQVEYMKNHTGEVFEGVISGVTEWGIYVEEKNTKSEGMIKIRDLGNDYYNLEKKTYSLVGEKTNKKFSLGDKVKVKLIDANLERKTLDFILV